MATEELPQSAFKLQRTRCDRPDPTTSIAELEPWHVRIPPDIARPASVPHPTIAPIPCALMAPRAPRRRGQPLHLSTGVQDVLCRIERERIAVRLLLLGILSVVILLWMTM